MSTGSSFEVTMDLSERGLGFSVVGGVDVPALEGNAGIFLSHVDAAGAGAAAGLRAGDRLVTLGGADLTGVTHATAVAAIRAELQSLSVTAVVARDAALANVTTAKAVPLVAETRVAKGRTAAAQAAYKSGDAARSKAVHESMSQENHQTESGQYIKAAVFGGLDGIITTFAVVASVAGANLPTGVVIIMGFSNLIADGISMGFGEFISAKSEMEYVRSERNREEWEYDNGYDAECAEMVELYEEKGFSKREAESIISVMAPHKEFFIDHMLVQELGMMPPDEGDSPFKAGLVMFFAFLTFGLIPLLAYIALIEAFPADVDPEWKRNTLFGIACGLTGLALFMLGAVKSKFSTQSWWVSGAWMLLNGTVAAAAAYGIGAGLEAAVGDSLASEACHNNSTL